MLTEDCWTQPDDDSLSVELQREVAEGHVLFNVPVRAVSRYGDDVLFELLESPTHLEVQDRNAKYAEVHLTWCADGPDVPPWPSTKFYPSMTTWRTAHQFTPAGPPVEMNTPARHTFGLTKLTWFLLFVVVLLLTIVCQVV